MTNYFYHLNSTWYKNNQKLRNYSPKWLHFRFDDSVEPEQYGTVQLGGRAWSIPCMLDASSVAVGTWDNSIRCFDIETLKEKWAFKTEGPVYSSPAVLPDGSFIIGCEDGRLRLITSEGKQIWQFFSGGPFHASPTIDLARRAVYAGSYDHTMYSIDIDSGELRWKVDLDPDIEDDVYSSPALTNGGNIIFGTGSRLLCLDPTGKIVWQINALGRFTGTAALDYERGTGILGTAQCGLIYVFRISDGHIVAKLHTNGQVVSSPTLGFDGVASIGSNDGQVYGVDMASGELKWVCPVGHEFRWTPFTTLPSGRSLFVAVDELVHCVDPNAGKEIWSVAMEGGGHSAPLVTPNGRMVVGSHRDQLHFFRWH